MSMLSILGVLGTKSTMRKIVPFLGGTRPTWVLPRSAVQEKSGGLASVTHISPAGWGQRKLASWTLPSNIATALPDESSLVTTRRTSGGSCCCAAAGPASATAALMAAKDDAIFMVLLLWNRLQKVRDRVGIVAQERQLVLSREVQPFALVDEVAHEQHPQADVDRIVEVAPRHVHVRRGVLEPLKQPLDLGLELERRETPLRVLHEHGRYQRHRDDRNDAPDRLHEVRAERRSLAPALFAREPLEIHAALAAVGAHRNGRAEVDAGVAEAVPLALEHQPHVARHEGERVPERFRATNARRFRVERAQEAAVLEHAVVVDSERHKHEVVLAVQP